MKGKKAKAKESRDTRLQEKKGIRRKSQRGFMRESIAKAELWARIRRPETTRKMS